MVANRNLPCRCSSSPQDLAVRRGERTVFSGLSFAVSPGEALILTGPNGAGKTTLIRTIAGLSSSRRRRARAGSWRSDRSIGEQCHYVGHRNALKIEHDGAGERRLLATISVAGQSDRLPGQEGAALDTFGLLELSHIPAGYLSDGQQRRLCLARLQLTRRPVWLLDEPTAALDAASQGVLEAVIDRHLRTGGIAVVATHQPIDLSLPARAEPRRRRGGRMKPFLALLRRDLELAVREGSAVGAALGFFLIVVAVMPLGPRTRSQLAVAHRARRSMDRLDAGCLALGWPHVRGRRRRWLARGPGHRVAAAGDRRRSEKLGPLVDHRAPVDLTDAGARLTAQPGHRRLSDAAGLPHRRHPGREFPRRNVRGLTLKSHRGGLLLALLVAAALHPDTDLRHLHHQRRAHGAGRTRGFVPAPAGDFSGLHRHRAVGNRGGPAPAAPVEPQ